MKSALVRGALPAMLALSIASPAFAHFSWIVPDSKGVRVLLSETPRFDGGVDGGIVAPTVMAFKGADGVVRPLTLRKAANEWVAETGGPGTVSGTLDLGLTRRGEVPHVLLYYPKAIAGDVFGKDAQAVGAAVELFVVGTPGAARLKLVADGRPVPESELTVVFPDDTEKKVRTDAQGLTPPLTRPGRYGAWARHWLDTPGERDGAPYKQVRRYATLVFDLPDTGAAPAAAMVAPAGRLPRAASSFGAAVSGDWLYVYGGHVSPTHSYSRDAVTGAFHRMNLASGAWEALPEGPTVQGMNLGAHADRILRVGGMRPENAPGTPADTRSLSDVSGWNPVTRAWEALPPLPSPRSSHDVAVVGDEVFVIGGWNMRGSDPAVWADNMAVLDVRAQPLRWESRPQPFQRRAFVTTVRGNLIYVIGGMDPEGKVLDTVDVYDVATASWSDGPPLPKGPRNGFAPAACTLDNRVYVSLGDGGLYRLDDVSGSWERIATTTARLAHRLVAATGQRLLLLGGAAGDGMLDVIESIDVSPAAIARAGRRTEAGR